MNKRELMLNVIEGRAPAGYTPAAFFLHFGPEYHTGQAAIDRHLQFFRHTGMDFVKIQYEQGMSTYPLASPADWARAPRLTEEDFAPTVNVVRGLVEAAGRDALVLLTLYSPFMWARHLAGADVLHKHLREHPAEAVMGSRDQHGERADPRARASVREWTASMRLRRVARPSASGARTCSRSWSSRPTRSRLG